MDLYCKIFIDTNLEYDAFSENVRNFLNGKKVVLSGIVSEWCDMDIRKNKEYIPANTDFLYWKFIIDLEPQNNISENVYINNVIMFMDFLKKEFKAICACDFEKLL